MLYSCSEKYFLKPQQIDFLDQNTDLICKMGYEYYYFFDTVISFKNIIVWF